MYQLAFLPEVEGDLRRLDRPIRQRIHERKVLIVHAVGHRRDIYKVR